MDQIVINDTLNVGASPDAVIVGTTGACDVDGVGIGVEAFLILSREDAVQLAQALMHAVANLPEEDFSDVPAEYL